MTGANNDVVVKLAEEFNAAQKDYKVVAELQGLVSRHHECRHRRVPGRQRAAHHAGVRGRHGDHDGRKGAVKPVHQLMKEAGETFDPKAYLPAITGYYSTAKGEMLSFPFNSSSMVMWINKDALKKAECRDPRRPGPRCSRPARS